ncbi:MAG: hypothetical protein E5Y19_24160 [Mesorhizobium sp.]|nr:MAG: hypothetical protein E5Y19_24160 [Mesorhizobium sp.]
MSDSITPRPRNLPVRIRHRQLAQFLAGDSDGGANQIPPAEFRSILDVFDRHWLSHSEQA